MTGPSTPASSTTVEDQVRNAILAELARQAEIAPSGGLTVEAGDDKVTIHGPVDLDDLVMVVMGSIAGGP